MGYLGTLLFLAGVIITGCYAAFPVTRLVDGQALTGWARIVDWASQAGGPFTIGLVFLVGGGLISRAARKRPAAGADPAAAAADTRAMLGKMAALLDSLSAEADDVHQTQEALNTLLEDEVPEFLESRQQMVDSLGLELFAEMIGQFAAMERNAARAWSAITDEAPQEVPPCLERARTALKHCIDAYDRGPKDRPVVMPARTSTPVPG